MASQASFDVSTGADLQEVDNAVNQATKEVAQRYDFKGSKASIAFDRANATLTLVADDDFKMKALLDVLQGKLVKRGVSLKALDAGEPRQSGKDYKLSCTIKEGITDVAAKKIASRPNDGSGAMLGRSGAAGGKTSLGETATAFELRLSTCRPPVPSETARTR